MDAIDWIKTGILVSGAWYIGNRITGNGLKKSLYALKEKVNETVTDNKIVHGGVGAVAGVYGIPKLEKIVKTGVSDGVKSAAAGAGVGAVVGTVYNKKKDEVNRFLNPTKVNENYEKE